MNKEEAEKIYEENKSNAIDLQCDDRILLQVVFNPSDGSYIFGSYHFGFNPKVRIKENNVLDEWE